MALPLYSLPESNTIRGTGNSFHFLGKQESDGISDATDQAPAADDSR